MGHPVFLVSGLLTEILDVKVQPIRMHSGLTNQESICMGQRGDLPNQFYDFIFKVCEMAQTIRRNYF